MTTTKGTHRLEKIGDGVYWAEIYWMVGANTKKGEDRSEINSGVPHLGWGRCFLIDKDPASKVVTLFCPYTFEGFQVTRDSFEYNGLRPPQFWDAGRQERCTREWRREWHTQNLYDKWDEAVRKRWQKDFNTAVVLFKALGLEVPQGVPEGMEAKVSGGKEADVLGLLKPVKRTSRTGQVLAYFWPNVKSIREAMADLSMTRSNVLSQLYLLQKNHGIGYTLQSDQAIITMPAGCEDPYAAAA